MRIAAAGLGMALPWAALAAESNVGVTAEDSVLVATREAPVSKRPGMTPVDKNAGEDELEPISQYPEHTPELADQAAAEAGSDDKFSTALAGATEVAVDRRAARQVQRHSARQVHGKRRPLRLARAQADYQPPTMAPC